LAQSLVVSLGSPLQKRWLLTDPAFTDPKNGAAHGRINQSPLIMNSGMERRVASTKKGEAQSFTFI